MTIYAAHKILSCISAPVRKKKITIVIMKKLNRKQILVNSKLRTAFIFLSFLLCHNSNAQDKQNSIAIITGLEYSWHHAYVSHDSNVLKEILADDFINLGRTGGRATKQKILENFKKDSAIYEYCEPFDFEFRIFNNTVIVLCKSKEKGTENGKPFSNVYFSYDIFIKRHKKWQCVQAGVNLIPNK